MQVYAHAIFSPVHQEYRKALFLAHFSSYYILMICMFKLFADDVVLNREIKSSADCYCRKILITSIHGQLSGSYV